MSTRTSSLRSAPFIVAASILAFAACSNSAAAPGTGVDGGGISAECNPPVGATGNSKHVGAYCTPNGGQCDPYGISCAVDLDPRGGYFCIVVGCTVDSDCGGDACCTGDPGNPVHACVPVNCLVDGGGTTCPAGS